MNQDGTIITLESAYGQLIALANKVATDTSSTPISFLPNQAAGDSLNLEFITPRLNALSSLIASSYNVPKTVMPLNSAYGQAVDAYQLNKAVAILKQSLFGASVGTNLPSIGSLIFKLSSDSLALTDGAAVSSWVDSINGATATAAGTAKPTFKVNQYGGKPSVRFDGVANIMQLGRPAALTAAVDSTVYSIVVVHKPLGALANGLIFSALTGSVTGVAMYSNSTDVGVYDSAGAFHVTNNGDGLVKTIGYTSRQTTPWQVSLGPRAESYINGSRNEANAQTSAGTQGANFAIGGRSSLADLLANDDLFEILVWSTPLTPSDMIQVQKYICDKYSQPYPWAAIPYFTVFDGDSITAGIGQTSFGNAGSYPSQAVASMALIPGQYSNVGVGSAQLRSMAAKISDWSGIAALTGKPVRVAAFEYYNENGTAPATMQGYATAYCNAVRAVPNTKLIFGTSTSSALDPDANRTAYNTWLATNQASLCDAYVAIHLNASIGVSGAAAVDANTTYFSDGIHLKNAGYTILSSLFKTAITSF